MNLIAKNRPLAIAALVLLLLAAVLVGPVRSVRSQESKLEKAFTSSAELYESVKPALVEFSRNADRFLDVYRQITGSDDEDSRAMANLLATFEAEMNTPFLSVTPAEIGRIAGSLYARVEDRDTEKDDARFYYRAMDDLIRKLAHNDEYNKAAEDFNKQTADFPAKHLRRGEAVVFR